ncbi:MULTISPECIES: YfiT family bacillithiol transferase [unclassified Lysinibacillus]|uniref:YfiT family bacillithiol transferase n=1 Tax=unclassified Lysinibacillus TaxID=2636778 RepID=UPI0008849450|nr:MULTISPECIES: putative metal-dependent hydrolase [unclassified Lysinibacillus]SCY85222.1 DinB superfamily protein [Lysinibacillus sp. SG9]SDB37121.1 DinB superfamily protein [Lysinibacillus sp. TC-37]SFS79742.1 DinB superfamily protein [Lysinibacillus sp. SG55]
MTDLRYPIGQFQFPKEMTPQRVQEWIVDIRLLPKQLAEALSGASEHALAKSYRENGWTVTQLVHHIADSHMNSYIRFKLALTEDVPTIKPYNEAEWAQLPDSEMLVATSFNLIENLHERWVYLLTSLTEEQLQRAFHHPDSGLTTLEHAIGLYAWHGKHHLAHIQHALTN